jgi:hypothetical protein
VVEVTRLFAQSLNREVKICFLTSALLNDLNLQEHARISLYRGNLARYQASPRLASAVSGFSLPHQHWVGFLYFDGVEYLQYSNDSSSALMKNSTIACITKHTPEG